MIELRQLLRTHSYLFALVAAAGLLIANVIVLPAFGDPSNWSRTLAVFTPFALAAVASTPAVVSGGGGLDLSIGPLMSFISIVLVVYLLPSSLGYPAISIPIVLALGAIVGAASGFLITVLRYEPVIATLCALFILSGVDLKLAPSPVAIAGQNWTTNLGGSFGSIPGALLPIAAAVGVWLFLGRTSYHRTLYGIGGSDAAAFSAGVKVAQARIIAYALGGLFAAIGGIALTALIQAADATTGLSYIIPAFAAVALGGTPIGRGGRGGLLGSLLGAAILYLVQNLLGELQVDTLWLQIVYGGMLLSAVILGALVTAPPRTPRPRPAT
jgi:ribose transport system permease protein